MRHVPARSLALGLALALFTVAAACSGGGGDDSATTGTTTPGKTSVQGVVRIEGTFTTMVATAASFDAINPPFTVEIPEVGRGTLEISEANVGGKLKSIVWSGGRPLPVSGNCSLDVGEADIQIIEGTLVVGLDGNFRTLNAGKCKFGTSVAVGDAESGELGDPVDSYSFNLDEATEFQTTGGATVAATPARKFEGRARIEQSDAGERLTGQLGLIGKLTITANGKKHTAGRLGFDDGAWIATVTTTGDPNVLKVVVEGEGIVNFADK